jgi:type I restriction enzyme, S subunit
MVPKGWTSVSLSEVSNRISDGIHSTPNYSSGTAYHFVNGNNIRDGRLVIWPATKCVDEGEYLKHKKDLGDQTLLISINGTIGNIGFYRGESVVLGKSAAFVNLHTNVFKEYVYHFLTGASAQQYFVSELTGTTIRNLSLKSIKDAPLPLPPLPEQRKIADILSTWDRAIETSEALLDTARSQKRALMQSLLTGKRRFPEFEGQDWKEVRLGDVADIDRNSLGSKTNPDFGFDYISLSNIEPGRIAGPLEKLIFQDAPSRARRKIQSGDILISTVRPNLLGFAKVTGEYSECIASTGFAVVTCRKGADQSYMFHYLFGHHMTSQIHALVVGSSYPAINSSDVRKLKINIPTLDEQKRIGGILDDCDAEINSYEDGAMKLRSEKKALMQQLLTGKRRVVV